LSAIDLRKYVRGCVSAGRGWSGQRGRSHDRKRVRGGQTHEVRYGAKKRGKSTGAVKGRRERSGPSPRKLER